MTSTNSNTLCCMKRFEKDKFWEPTIVRCYLDTKKEGPRDCIMSAIMYKKNGKTNYFISTHDFKYRWDRQHWKDFQRCENDLEVNKLANIQSLDKFGRHYLVTTPGVRVGGTKVHKYYSH